MVAHRPGERAAPVLVALTATPVLALMFYSAGKLQHTDAMTTLTSSALGAGSHTAPTAEAGLPDLPRASQQDGEYPRPQLLRRRWADLDGAWAFRHDDTDAGLREAWHTDLGWSTAASPERNIRVPFPPESRASGVGDTGFHPVVWYRRGISLADLDAAGLDLAAFDGPHDDPMSADRVRVLLHFGAVDYRCQVWLDEESVGTHEGGHTPFTIDVTEVIRRHRIASPDPSPELDLVVRAEDDPHDVEQPRGKQDWHRDPHSIWYHRTTGIWQTVWLEAVPDTSIARVQWTPDVVGGQVRASVDLRGRASLGASIRIAADFGGEPLGAAMVPLPPDAAGAVEVTIGLPAMANGQGYDRLLWSPEQPRLIDATVELVDGGGETVDAVSSYFGLRQVGVEHGRFLLNDRPYFVRSVLNQGYWPESLLAAPSHIALRREVELIRDLGFNATRVHQKIEDPRFLFWADRLGLLVWGETPGAFAFSRRSIELLMHEWVEAVQRDLSHPSIVTWVPVNESWGVQHIAHDPAQRAYATALASVTRALDPTRPVISNDGWEHVDSDIITIHDYEASGATLAATYADEAARARLLGGIGPAGRRVLLPDDSGCCRDGGAGAREATPAIMLTEFGGVRYEVGQHEADAWGYSTASDADDFAQRVGALLDAVRSSPFLAGFCYTQLTDTEQEANGLLTERREPKLPIEDIRAIITGQH